MQDREARELRRRVARLQRGRPGFRFSPSLRQRITAWVAVQRKRGVWWCDLEREIGVPAETLKRWTTSRGTVTLVSPTGLRIEGVAVVDAIAILRGLL